MSYPDVDVIVEGALDSSETFEDDALSEANMAVYIEGTRESAEADGLRTEVYILYHDHDMSEDECSCAQYVTDGHPAYSWNTEEE